MSKKERDLQDKQKKQHLQRRALFLFEYAFDELIEHYETKEVKHIFKTYFNYIE